jgi:hypothetical protein
MVRLQFNAARNLLRLLLALFAIESVLLLADLTLNHAEWTDYGPVQRFFNIAREDGVASWFQVTQTLFVALTLWLISALSFADNRPRLVKWGWLVFALFYSFLAFDDGAQFHERVGTIVEMGSGGNETGMETSGERSGSESTGWFPTYFWHLAMGPFFAAAGLFLLWFALREMKKDRTALTLFLLGMAAMGAAQVLDFFEGMSPVEPLNPLLAVRKFTGYGQEEVEHFSRAVEETIEMISMSYFWIAYLMVLVREFPDFTVSLRNRSE